MGARTRVSGRVVGFAGFAGIAVLWVSLIFGVLSVHGLGLSGGFCLLMRMSCC
jgi:hypothetical protein